MWQRRVQYATRWSIKAFYEHIDEWTELRFLEQVDRLWCLKLFSGEDRCGNGCKIAVEMCVRPCVEFLLAMLSQWFHVNLDDKWIMWLVQRPELFEADALEIVPDEITKMEVGNENGFQVKVLDVVVRVNDAFLSGSFQGGRAIVFL